MSGPGHFRGLARRPVSLAGTLSAGGGWVRPARLTDLGLGGARVLVEAELTVGTSVLLTVEAPNRWDPLQVEAKVSWSREHDRGTEAGLAFVRQTRGTVHGLLELLGSEAYD
jgi:Tfp pilus assembly protein PilZ